MAPDALVLARLVDFSRLEPAFLPTVTPFDVSRCLWISPLSHPNMSPLEDGKQES